MAILRGCFYVIGNRENGLYKIGFCRSDPRKRLKELQAGCPLELKLVIHLFVKYAAKTEKLVHVHFDAQRLSLGSSHQLTEWFKLSVEEVQQIPQLVPSDQLLPEQHLEQDHRKEVEFVEKQPDGLLVQGRIYKPPTLWRKGLGLLVTKT